MKRRTLLTGLAGIFASGITPDFAVKVAGWHREYLKTKVSAS